MKILHIITGLGLGGAETALFRIVSNNRDNDSIAVVTLGKGGVYADRIRELGITVFILGMPRGRLTISGLFNLYRYIRNSKPDIVQTWMYHADLVGGIIAKLAGAKAIFWGIRNSNLDREAIGSGSRLVAKLCALFSRWVPSRIISCAQVAVGVHVRYGYSEKKFVVIPNGYDLEQFVPDAKAGAAVRAELKIPSDLYLIGMVARFDPQKDHANLIGAMALLQQRGVSFKCILIGGDMDHQNSALCGSIKQADIEDSVKLLGPRSDIIAAMNALDLHVLSSFGEGFPNVVAEAMACGTPCVVTDVGDAGLIVGEEGWVVPSQNSNALADAIALAINEKSTDPDAWRDRKDKCRKTIINNYSIENMVDAYKKTWLGEISGLNSGKVV